MNRRSDDTEMYTVTVAMEIEAGSAEEASRTAKSAVNLSKATSRGQEYGDHYVQRIERPLQRVERIDVIKTSAADND